ncbi:hypothetical protein CRENBAI_014620 [Crenichthys baileyi]|uniref:Uncharacterized protein n=1 Tax=Crenichthys baileyi TaxID=28760 RepID=A0AAV9SBN5_9TELE
MKQTLSESSVRSEMHEHAVFGKHPSQFLRCSSNVADDNVFGFVLFLVLLRGFVQWSGFPRCPDKSPVRISTGMENFLLWFCSFPSLLSSWGCVWLDGVEL